MKEQFIHMTSEDVRANMTRIEVDSSHTQYISEQLQQNVFGQTEACDAVARRVAMFDANLSDPDRPLGVEMFLGPTGVGKTEMSHALAEFMFGDRNSEQLKIIDCAELSQEHTVARLLGSPPGYVGYGAEPLITNDLLINRNIIVFDEIEKADPALHRLLLGVMEDSRMTITTQKGQEELNFSNSLIIMTSNVGSREVDEAQNGRKPMGFGAQETQKTDTTKISTEALKQRFAPEFINRIDDVVVFKNLEAEQFDQIFYKFIDEINDDLAKHDPQPPFVGATTEFKEFILDQVDRRYGARDMRRKLDKEMLEGMADVFMSMDMRMRPIVADREGDQTFFYTLDAPELPPIEDFDYENIGVEFIPEDDMFYGEDHEEDRPIDNNYEDKEADVTDPPKEKKPKKPKDEPTGEIVIPPNRTVDISVRLKENGVAIDSVTALDLPLFPYK